MNSSSPCCFRLTFPPTPFGAIGDLHEMRAGGCYALSATPKNHAQTQPLEEKMLILLDHPAEWLVHYE
ncbi:hypothetical protein TNCV_4198501 [Trichonephila clavipes]|nr:hypothetical protein TNCV_4198501 [Trichonephila clavipes]